MNINKAQSDFLPVIATYLMGLIFFFNKLTGYDPYILEKVASSLLLVLLFLLCFFNTKKIKFSEFVLYLSGLVSSFILLLLSFDTLEKSPLLFFSFAVASPLILGFRAETYISFDELNLIKKYQKTIYWCLCITFLLLYFLKVSWAFVEHRFIGISTSATTFGIWFIILYVVTYLVQKEHSTKFQKFLALVPVVLIVFMSGTRTNLLLCLLLSAYVLYPRGFENRLVRVAIIASLLVFVFSIYSLYSVLMSVISGEILAYRYEGGYDGSFYTRTFLFDSIWGEYLNADLFKQLFGFGHEASREYSSELIGFSIHPHNDVLRILFDHGFIFSVLFLVD